jgi:hypothetical protein
MMTDADVRFMDLGVQYYAAARAAVMANLFPVCGNLYHHAIEMLLKAGLSQKLSLSELKEFRHKLPKLWKRFKSEFPSIDQFDDVIVKLDLPR